jgi:AraC-like DNA-binding protein
VNDQGAHADDSLSQLDLIGEAIKEMRIHTASTGSVARRGVWTFPSRDSEGPVAYFLVRGQAAVTFEGGATAILEAGDLLVVTRTKAHQLHGLAPTQILQHPDGEQLGQASFLFATLQAKIASDCPFGSTMPEYFLFRAGERTESPYLEAQLQCLAWEARSGEAGSELMQARLWEIIFMHAFRVHLAKTKVTHGWLAAICDHQLSKVLRAIHRFPENEWTVERLAREAAMSRATLARRFASVLDDTPMDYLYRLRMRIAATLLKEPGASIPAIARRVGYASESAFSSAFHRRFNVWPGEFRDKEARFEF